MSKMTVIQLLNKIANGEIEANTELFYKKEKYRHIDNLFENYYVEEVLNDEVEIIEEEDKKIKKINIYNYSEHDIMIKVNEIIDKLNEGKE